MDNKIENKPRLNLDAEAIFVKKLIEDLSYDLVRIVNFFDQFSEEEKRSILRDLKTMQTNNEFIVRSFIEIMSKSKQEN